MTAPVNCPPPPSRRSPGLGLAQEKRSPGKELLPLDLQTGWATGETVEWKAASTGAVH